MIQLLSRTDFCTLLEALQAMEQGKTVVWDGIKYRRALSPDTYEFQPSPRTDWQPVTRLPVTDINQSFRWGLVTDMTDRCPKCNQPKADCDAQRRLHADGPDPFV